MLCECWFECALAQGMDATGEQLGSIRTNALTGKGAWSRLPPAVHARLTVRTQPDEKIQSSTVDVYSRFKLDTTKPISYRQTYRAAVCPQSALILDPTPMLSDTTS
jgi:hypothetical protein